MEVAAAGNLEYEPSKCDSFDEEITRESNSRGVRDFGDRHERKEGKGLYDHVSTTNTHTTRIQTHAHHVSREPSDVLLDVQNFNLASVTNEVNDLSSHLATRSQETALTSDQVVFGKEDNSDARVGSKGHSRVDLSQSRVLHCHGVEHLDLARASRAFAVSWRDSTSSVEQDSGATSLGGVGGRRQSSCGTPAQEPPSCLGDQDQSGQSQEVCSTRVGHPGPGVAHQWQRDDRDSQAQGHGEGPHDCGSTCRGLCGVRTVVPPQVCGSDDAAARLLRVGVEGSSGRRLLHPSSSFGQLVGEAKVHGFSQGDHFESKDPGQEQEGRRVPDTQGITSHGLNGQHGSDDPDVDRIDDSSSRTFQRAGTSEDGEQGGQTPHSSIRGRDHFECRVLGANAVSLEPTAHDVLEEPEARLGMLSHSEARSFDWQASRVIPESFEALVQLRRPILYEIACGPDSVMSAKMIQLTKRDDAARRFSFWNGYDVSSSQGVRSVLASIDKEKPSHVWLSLECGPFSKMQQVNQRNEKQTQELKQKRENCMRAYVGGLIIYIHCVQTGIPVTWEWAETSDAWRLPMVQNVFNKYPPKFCVTKGCRVKLQDPKSGALLGKGWKLATTHEGVASSMELPCRCQQKHVPCQGILTRMSAYYTDDFAKRACRAILQSMDSHSLFHELRGDSQLPRCWSCVPVECTCDFVRHPKSNLKCGVCELGDERCNPLSFVGDQGGGAEGLPPLTDEEKSRCLRNIAMLHRNTGHGPMEHLVKTLESRGTDPRVVALAKGYECSICKELSRQVPRPRVSLEPLPPKWKVAQADNAHWTHPQTNERVQFTIMIDEGSRFRIGKVMCKGSGGISGDMLIQFFQEHWKPVFGKPEKLRLDPAGPWRSNNLLEFMGKQFIEVDTIPAEGHWGISHVERSIQCTKSIMTKLATEEPSITPEEALSEALRVENEREIVRGFSPAQHALGRAPDLQGRFSDNGIHEVPNVLCENASGEFQRNVKRMKTAEQALSEFVHNDRLNRAKNTRCYKPEMFSPGDLVFVWRVQNRGSASSGRTGGFTGPARVLATETRVTEEGTYRPGSTVWLIRGSRLIKANPRQLRRASVREELTEELVNPPNLPWTTTTLAEGLGERQYDDVTDDVPEDMEFEQGVDEETIPLRRVRRKKHVPPNHLPVPSQETDEPGEPMFGHFVGNENGNPSFYAECFWSTEGAAVEIEIPIPDSKRGRRYMAENFESFLSAQLRRRGVEVSERHMDSNELQQMKTAKHEEVKKFIAADALQILPFHLQPNKGVAMKMRWVLTWKRGESGDKTAKARCVVLGYMDPNYEHRQTMAPTMSRTTRQVMLAVAAAHSMRVAKGDVSGAFLQGRSYQHDAYVIPTDEICDALQLAHGSVTKLKRACYGLVDAPLEWYLTVSDFLVSIGFVKCVTDPCCFKYVDDQQQLVGLISGHVDDFLFCGRPNCTLWKDLCAQIQEKFKWGTWEYDCFVQCGVKIEKTPSGGFSLSQAQYIDDVKEISISSERRREPKSWTTDSEKTKLRTALGAVSWCAQQTSPHMSAAVSLFLSQIRDSTVHTMIDVNKMIYKLKCHRKHCLLIHGGLSVDDMLVAGWADAAAQNRPDGKSTQGIFVGLTSKRLLQGEMCAVSPMVWQSSKIERQCRSPGAAESLAAINCEDSMYAVRLQLFELLGNEVNVRKTEAQVAQIDGVLVTDSTNVYDRMQSEVYVPKGPENRTALELLGLKEASVRTGMPIRWVHSDAQLANSLTKDAEQQQLQRFYNLGHRWKIVDDPLMRSARNRKKLGLEVFEEGDVKDNPRSPEELDRVDLTSGGC